jgi:hypothetical protein
MSNIKKLVAGKAFNDLTFLTKEPYFLEIKENDNKYMLLFTEKSDLTLPEVRESTGIIFEKETNNLLHFSFEKCYESLTTTRSEQREKQSEEGTDTFNVDDLKNYTMNLYFVGSMIKLYFDNGWQIASSKNLDASKSFWGTKKSFLDLFIDAIEISENVEYYDFIEKLDPNYCYTYIIQHPENSSLIKVKTPVAFILNKVNLTTLKEEIPDLENFKVDKKINEVNKNLTDNYILYNFNENGEIISRVKMLSNEYLNLKELYGNFPDIGLRYIENYYDERMKEKLIQNFPQYIHKFKKIEVLYMKAIKCIQMSYNNVYINQSRTFAQIPKSHIQIIKYMKENNTSITDYMQDKNPRQVAYIIMYTY